MPDLPQRRWLHHTPPAWAGDSTFFITICCQVRAANQLCIPATAEKLLAAVEHYHAELRWHISLCVPMPDHVHALISLPRTEDLSRTVAAWKRFTAREAGAVWQRGFFDHRLRHDESFEEKAHCIRMNPVRKNLCARPEDWPFIWPR